MTSTAPRPGRLPSSGTATAPEALIAMPFSPALRTRLAANLAGHEPETIPLDGRRHAAVAVVVVDSDPAVDGRDDHPFSRERLDHIPGAAGFQLTGSVAGTAGGPAFLLTRRAPRLRSHSGQWALPGGRVDEGEVAVDAALRELREEVGLDLPRRALLGYLDDYATRSGYVITPCVLWAGGAPEIRPNPDEVLSVHRIGFHELCRPDSPRFVSIPESDRPVVQIPIGGDLIHAPTGAVLLQFRRVAIEGGYERVSAYEQPVFAWK